MKKAKKILSLMLILIMCFSVVPMTEIGIEAEASRSLSDSQITSIVEDYIDAVGNKYWNAGYSTQDLIAQVDRGDYYSATTSSQCPKWNSNGSHVKANGCTSNVFTGVSLGLSQCWGFGDYMEYVIFRTTSSSGWTKTTNIDSNFKFRPGDLIHSTKNSSSQHIMIVYKVVDSRVFIIEANYGARCKINTRELIDAFSYVNASNSYVMIPPDSLRTDIHVHSYERAFSEALHPHKVWYSCSCGDGYYSGEENLSYTYGYENEHPHKRTKTCWCGDVYYTGETRCVSSCEACKSENKHTYERAFSEALHPHKVWYSCSCGDGYYSGEENLSYTYGYEDEHPHKKTKTCWCGDVYYIGGTETVDTCKYCNWPDKPSFSSWKDTCSENETIQFKWNSTKNTTHYNIWLYVKNSKGEWEKYEHMTYVNSGVTKKLPANEYRCELKAYNSNFYHNSTWLYSESDFYYFTVTPVHTHGYTSTITTQPTCTKEGVKTYKCSCGASYTESIAKATHNSNTTIPAVTATCTKTGLTEGKKCSVCGTVTVAQQTVAKKSHIDNNGDYKCDYGCGYAFEKPAPDTPTTPDEPENKPCSCNCHKGGISGFFFKLINFFEKLFGKNKVCACGVKH